MSGKIAKPAIPDKLNLSLFLYLGFKSGLSLGCQGSLKVGLGHPEVRFGQSRAVKGQIRSNFPKKTLLVSGNAYWQSLGDDASKPHYLNSSGLIDSFYLK